MKNYPLNISIETKLPFHIFYLAFNTWLDWEYLVVFVGVTEDSTLSTKQIYHQLFNRGGGGGGGKNLLIRQGPIDDTI